MIEDNDLEPLRYEELKPQNEIRLIQSLPGGESAEIECSLSRIDLGEGRRTYPALSYVWGDPSVTKAIAVNSHSFQVTRNLATAIYHVRLLTPNDEP